MSLVCACAAMVAAAPGATARVRHRAPAKRPVIEVVSGRADLVSGGEALVAIQLPRGTKLASVGITLGGRNVKRQFARRPAAARAPARYWSTIRADYYPVMFTPDEWATLQQVFPTGVCDWSRPGLGQQPTIPWLTYQTAGGSVIYGGQSLGRAPAGSGLGWTSPSFAGWTAP